MPIGGIGDALSPQQWFQTLPIVTRYWFGATVLLTLAANFQIISPSQLFFSWKAIQSKFELWRLLSCFCYAGPFEFSTLISIYMLVQFSRQYESGGPFNTGAGGGTADYAFCLLFGTLATLVTYPLVVMILKVFPLFTRNIIFYVLYVWSRRHPTANANIWGVPVPGVYLPFAYLVSFVGTPSHVAVVFGIRWGLVVVRGCRPAARRLASSMATTSSSHNLISHCLFSYRTTGHVSVHGKSVQRHVAWTRRWSLVLLLGGRGSSSDRQGHLENSAISRRSIWYWRVPSTSGASAGRSASPSRRCGCCCCTTCRASSWAPVGNRWSSSWKRLVRSNGAMFLLFCFCSPRREPNVLLNTIYIHYIESRSIYNRIQLAILAFEAVLCQETN